MSRDRGGTEPAHSSDMCALFEPGVYGCVCCGTNCSTLRASSEARVVGPASGRRWRLGLIAHHYDSSHGMTRIETTCNVRRAPGPCFPRWARAQRPALLHERCGVGQVMMNFDTIVIGAGQAGPFLAAKLVDRGRNVALVEARDLGGTCVNRGCTPPRLCASRRGGLPGASCGRVRCARAQ